MPRPDEEPDRQPHPERRPSHFREKRPENTTKLIRVSDRRRSEPEVSHVARTPVSHHDGWSDVINAAPGLPNVSLKRPIPPPAPLPSEAAHERLRASGWVEERARRKRKEDIIGTLGLAVMVAAMLAAMWLRMTSP